LVLVVAGFLVLMFVANWHVWRKHKEHDEFHTSINELQLDLIGLVVSFVGTQAIRHALTGQYPAAHGFLQTGNAPAGKTEQWHRWFMLGWSIGLTVIAALVMPTLNKMTRGSSHEIARQCLHVLKVVIIMHVAWGFLLWGQWEFHDHLFPTQGLFGNILFALLATFVCLGVLLGMAKFSAVATTREAKQTYDIVTTGISLVAAWSWEQTFNTCFEIVGQAYQVGYEGLVPKLVLSVVVPAAVLPLYLSYIRPEVKKFEEEAEAREAAHPSEASDY